MTNLGNGDGDWDSDGLKTWGKSDVSEDLGHQLRFTFEQKPKNIQDGYVFGSNPKTCDVILGRPEHGISGSHFRITFDEQCRLVLIDLSTNGTAVSYNGQARKDKRKNPPDRTRRKPRKKSNDFTWILFPELKNKRVVIGEDIEEFPNAPIFEFLVEVADPGKPDTYLRHTYLQEIQTAIPFGLNLDSHPTTAGQTESHSPRQRPSQRPIWIDLEEIGRGEFGTVYQAVDVSTAVIYAAKMFLRSGKDSRERWDREVAILRKISHVKIISRSR